MSTLASSASAVGSAEEHAPRPVGLSDAALVLTSPRSVFRRVEDTGAYGMTLLSLILIMFAFGWAESQTGLIDRTVDQATERQLMVLEETQGHLLDRVELAERIERAQKEGEFNKLMFRLGAMLVAPGGLLVSILLIAAFFYAAVALTGRKPEYHTLTGVCTYAGVVIVVAAAVRLAMVVYYRSTEFDTSLRYLWTGEGVNPLVAIDPFRVWFWCLVATGLIVTRQLGRIGAISLCTLCLLIGSAARVGISAASS